MKPLSIRASLTLWFVGLTTVLLTVFSGALYLGIRDAVRSGLDTRLRERAEAFAGLCEWEEDIDGVEFELGPSTAAELDSNEVTRCAEVWTWPDGELLHRSGATELTPPPDTYWAAPLRARMPSASFETLRGSDPAHPPGAVRACTLWMEVPAAPAEESGDSENDQPGAPAFAVLVRVGEGTAATDAQLGHIAWVIGILGAVASAVVLAFGVFLSRRFVAPLQHIRAAADDVRRGATASMPRRGTGDELDDLAGVLDEAFQSLERSIERQRRFTADAAHELRNPIAVIRNASEVALRSDRSAAEYRAFLQDVRFTALRTGSILEALLLLARMDAGAEANELRPVDLAALAMESADAPGRSPGSIHASNGTAQVVLGEPVLLRILIDNLVTNALTHAESNAPVEVGVTRTGDSIVLCVRDHGRGVPPEDVAHVFERFRRVAQGGGETSGAGLGLSIVSEIARLHSAECRMESDATGTVVTVVFPAPSLPATTRPAAGSRAVERDRPHARKH